MFTPLESPAACSGDEYIIPFRANMGFNAPCEPPRWKVEDFLTGLYHDQILVERGECRFCVVVSNTGLFPAVEMIGVELNGLFGLLDLPVGNVFPGLEILQKSPERLCRISIPQAF